MKRRGFLKWLAVAPVALAVKPPKKKKYVHRPPMRKSPRISDKDIRDAHFEIIEEKMKEAMAEIMAEEDRQLFALARRASRRVTEVI